METIGLVAPDLSSYEEARGVIARHQGDVILSLGLQEQGVAEAAKLVRQGVDIIISRGETAKAIQAAFPDVTVVTIKRSGFDIARALGRAMLHGGPIAVVVFPYIVARISAVCDAFGIEASLYPVPRREESGEMVKKAVAEGARVIVGAVTGQKTAEQLGVPYELVRSGEESLTEALEEAHAIMRARHADKITMSLQHAVLNATDEGIIAVDADGVVTLMNAVAERYLGMDAKDALGKSLRAVWPELDFENALSRGEAEPNILVKAMGQTLVCALSPVRVDAAVSGAVCTFHDAGRLQAMEASVRRRLASSGHVAATRFHDIQGKSAALTAAVNKAKEYAMSEDTILLSGETGVGKELFAQSIHNHSARAKGPFVAVNCAALPGSLLESELFGYVAGAFTGASSKGKAGLFELAHGGTIFLDEVTETDPAIQAKLLRVLQEKKVMRLGSDQVMAVDVRIIASTNKNLKELVSGGTFRRDLYYRLSVLLLTLPPLRDRRDDIPILCRYFLDKRTQPGQDAPKLAPDAFTVLKAHAWPGNIRELRNVMARTAVTAKGTTLGGADILAMLDPDEEPPEVRALAALPAEEILVALRETRGNRARAAERLGVSRSTLWRRMRKIGMA